MNNAFPIESLTFLLLQEPGGEPEMSMRGTNSEQQKHDLKSKQEVYGINNIFPYACNGSEPTMLELDSKKKA